VTNPVRVYRFCLSCRYEEIIKVNRDAYAVTKVAIPEFLKFMSNTNVPGVKVQLQQYSGIIIR